MVKTYYPSNLAEALEIRNKEVTLPFAGGTDLMVKYKTISGALADFPRDILFLGDLDELKEIEISRKAIRIGAAVKLSTLLKDQAIPPYIKKPLERIGSPAIRNLATIGGNICNASPAGDSLPLLYALDAILELSSSRGTRKVKIGDFIKGPGMTTLKVDEILSGIYLPRYDHYQWGFRKIGARKTNAISKLSIFWIYQSDQSLLKDIRLALGSLGPAVIRSRIIEKTMMGLTIEQLSGESDRILEAYGSVIAPIDDVRSTRAYRGDVALGILREILERLE